MDSGVAIPGGVERGDSVLGDGGGGDGGGREEVGRGGVREGEREGRRERARDGAMAKIRTGKGGRKEEREWRWREREIG